MYRYICRTIICIEWRMHSFICQPVRFIDLHVSYLSDQNNNCCLSAKPNVYLLDIYLAELAFVVVCQCVVVANLSSAIPFKVISERLTHSLFRCCCCSPPPPPTRPSASSASNRRLTPRTNHTNRGNLINGTACIDSKV